MPLITSALRTEAYPSVPRIKINNKSYLRMKELSELCCAAAKAPIADKMAAEYRLAHPAYIEKVAAKGNIDGGFYVKETAVTGAVSFMQDADRQQSLVNSFFAISTWSKSNNKPSTATGARTQWPVTVTVDTKLRIKAYIKANKLTIDGFLAAAIDVFENQAREEEAQTVTTATDDGDKSERVPSTNAVPANENTTTPSTDSRLAAIAAHIGAPIIEHISKEMKVLHELIGEQEIHVDKRFDEILEAIRFNGPSYSSDAKYKLPYQLNGHTIGGSDVRR